MAPGFGEFPTFFLIAFGVAVAFIVVVLVVMVTSMVRSRKVLQDNGLDPLTAQAQIVAGLARGPLTTPVRNLEQRLAELDDLHRRGVITTTEHQEARRHALGG
jgi:competence protein ComGC